MYVEVDTREVGVQPISIGNFGPHGVEEIGLSERVMTDFRRRIRDQRVGLRLPEVSGRHPLFELLAKSG